MRIGVVRNRRSHGNWLAETPRVPDGVLLAEPDTHDHLRRELARFAQAGVDTLVIDGGDGTVRDVLSVTPDLFAAEPLLAVLPSGKTNVLALDLGARRGVWTLDAALARLGETDPPTKTRSALEVSWADGRHAPMRGFVIGAGVFVRGTKMAKSVHDMGAFHSLSVALTLAGAAVEVLFGGAHGRWRRGVDIRVQADAQPAHDGHHLLAMATTLKRLPLGLKPFGPPREGMKVLEVDAPPRRLLAALPPILRGENAAWLEPAGYRRSEARTISLTLSEEVVIDGELYPGGEITVREGPPLRFLTPVGAP